MASHDPISAKRSAATDHRTPHGRLLLVPSTLDHLVAADMGVDLRQLLPDGVLATIARLQHWVCENAKPARAFLKRVDQVVPLEHPLQSLDIRELPRAPKGRAGVTPVDLAGLLVPARAGFDVGLLSDAGMPAVADPGAALVAQAHASEIAVCPLVGPSSLLLALAASGLNGQSFAFVGYIPQDAPAQAERLKALETLSRRLAQTQLMIETPYRNPALLRALKKELAPTTRLSVSCGLTLDKGWSRTHTVSVWRGLALELPADVPAVFALLA